LVHDQGQDAGCSRCMLIFFFVWKEKIARKAKEKIVFPMWKNQES
jgi:hypothetical protein